MRLTLLGSGDATGVPAPLCDCEYCAQSAPRRRPALLVEDGETTVVLDAGPDLAEQLRRTDTYEVDAFFLTHFHRDHADGLLDLLQTLRTGTETAWNDAGDAHAFGLYMTPTATDHLRETFPYFLDLLDPAWDPDGTSIGPLDVRPFPVEHMRPDYETVGFVVTDGKSAVAYAPDMEGFVDDPPSVAGGVDLFVCEGSPVVGVNHGDETDLLPAIEALSADRTVLVNASEHARREHTATLESHAAAVDCELGTDFDEYAL
jgi:phosphoribosyl 1,2-cyclic phosphodiesterase